MRDASKATAQREENPRAVAARTILSSSRPELNLLSRAFTNGGGPALAPPAPGFIVKVPHWVHSISSRLLSNTSLRTSEGACEQMKKEQTSEGMNK